MSAKHFPYFKESPDIYQQLNAARILILKRLLTHSICLKPELRDALFTKHRHLAVTNHTTGQLQATASCRLFSPFAQLHSNSDVISYG